MFSHKFLSFSVFAGHITLGFLKYECPSICPLWKYFNLRYSIATKYKIIWYLQLKLWYSSNFISPAWYGDRTGCPADVTASGDWLNRVWNCLVKATCFFLPQHRWPGGKSARNYLLNCSCPNFFRFVFIFLKKFSIPGILIFYKYRTSFKHYIFSHLILRLVNARPIEVGVRLLGYSYFSWVCYNVKDIH